MKVYSPKNSNEVIFRSDFNDLISIGEFEDYPHFQDQFHPYEEYADYYSYGFEKDGKFYSLLDVFEEESKKNKDMDMNDLIDHLNNDLKDVYKKHSPKDLVDKFYSFKSLDVDDSMQQEVKEAQKKGVKMLKEKLAAKDVKPRNISLDSENDDIEEFIPPEEWDEYDDSVALGNRFLEGGKEYVWIKRMYGPVEDAESGSDFYVWMAGETHEDGDPTDPVYFVVDEDDGFIDWGPEDSFDVAKEFCEGKAFEEDVDEMELIDKKPEQVEVEDDFKAVDLFGKGNFTKYKDFYIVKNTDNVCYDIYDNNLELFEVGLDSVSEAKTIIDEEI